MILSAITKTRNGDTCAATKIGTATTNQPAHLPAMAVKIFSFEVKAQRERYESDKAAHRKLMFQEGGDSFWECVTE